MIMVTAASPVLPCKCAFVVRELAIGLSLYYQKKLRVNSVLQVCEKQVTTKKNTFDSIWRLKYSDNSEYWTFETIVQKFKDSLENIRKLDQSILPHLEAISKNSLLIKMLKVLEEICGANSNNSMDRFISLNPKLVVEKLLEAKIGNPETYDILKKAGQAFEHEINNAKSECRKVYIDIIGKLPKSIACRIFLLIGAKNLPNLRRVSKGWCAITRLPMLWRCLSYLNGWGIAFLIPKNMDWEKFYQTLSVLRKSKVASAIEIFNYEMAGISGVRAQKKMNAFLKKMPVMKRF